MTSNYNKDDPTFGSIDLDDEYITDAWLVDQFVGNDLWSCGQNTNGQLGLGTVVHRSSPVQVGSLTNWKLVSCGLYNTMSVKTDGTLWSCGYNNYGQLGLGTVVHRSSPVQVGLLTNWKLVTGGGYHTVAISSNDLPD